MLGLYCRIVNLSFKRLPSNETALCTTKSGFGLPATGQDTKNGRKLETMFSYIIHIHIATHISTECSKENGLWATTGDKISSDICSAQSSRAARLPRISL
jgi:hypothetical protein